MNQKTLLLDQNFSPITIIPWTRAITLLWLGKIEVIEEYDQEVRSPSIAIKLPAVVRLLQRIIRKKLKIRFSRQNIYLRDGGKCQYCFNKVPVQDATFDHVIPRSKGGKTKWGNIVIACSPCNLRKANKTPAQAKMYLRKQPHEPKNIPYVVFKLRHVDHVPTQWKDYLASIEYWTATLEIS